MVNKQVLENKFLKAEIIPELGGRIDGLVNKKTDFNWVWKNKYLNNTSVKKGSNYDENWQGGWEELFPNDAVEKFSWGLGYDHGETWSHNWKISNKSNENIELSAENLESGSIIKKTYILLKNKLRVEYLLNINFEEIFLFKLHLAIPISSACKLNGNFYDLKKVSKDFGNILNTDNEEKFFNPVKNSGYFDFAYVGNSAYNLQVEQENNLLSLNYDKTFLNYLWIFQTQGGWRNHNVIVIEPATNGKKLFKDAISANQYKKGPLALKTYYEVKIS